MRTKTIKSLIAGSALAAAVAGAVYGAAPATAGPASHNTVVSNVVADLNGLPGIPPNEPEHD